MIDISYLYAFAGLLVACVLFLSFLAFDRLTINSKLNTLKSTVLMHEARQTRERMPFFSTWADEEHKVQIACARMGVSAARDLTEGTIRDQIRIAKLMTDEPELASQFRVIFETSEGTFFGNVSTHKVHLTDKEFSVNIKWKEITINKDVYLYRAFIEFDGCILRDLKLRNCNLDKNDKLNIVYTFNN